MGIVEPDPSAQHRLAFSKILPARANMAPDRYRKLRANSAFRQSLRILLNENAVGTFWQWSTGENAHAFSRSYLAVECMARRCLADDRQFCPKIWSIGGAKSIAIHGGGVKWRLCQFCNQVYGQNAACCLIKGNALGIRNRSHRFQQTCQSFGNGKER